MKYCIKCGKKLKDNEKFCNKCGEKIKRNKISIKVVILSIVTIILVIVVLLVTINFVKREKKLNQIKQEVKNNIYDKNSEITYVNSSYCRRCVDSCDGACIRSEDIENCMIYEYDIKDNDVEYKAYYINNNGNVEYRNNRDIMLDIKYVKDTFNNKYKDYYIDIKSVSSFSSKKLYFENNITIEIVNYGSLNKVLTKELYKDIYNLIDKVSYVTLKINDNDEIIFYKDNISLMRESSHIVFYKVKLNDKTYEEIMKEIVDNYDRH